MREELRLFRNHQLGHHTALRNAHDGDVFEAELFKCLKCVLCHGGYVIAFREFRDAVKQINIIICRKQGIGICDCLRSAHDAFQ